MFVFFVLHFIMRVWERDVGMTCHMTWPRANAPVAQCRLRHQEVHGREHVRQCDGSARDMQLFLREVNHSRATKGHLDAQEHVRAVILEVLGLAGVYARKSQQELTAEAERNLPLILVHNHIDVGRDRCLQELSLAKLALPVCSEPHTR